MSYTHYLESEQTGQKIFTQRFFDREEVKSAIISHLQKNTKDCLYWYKVSNDKNFVGDDLIATYSMNKKNEPCLEVYKGNKLFYKTIS